jgi:hypothetical protein
LPTGPCVLSFSRYPRRDSNPQAPGFKPGRSAGWRTRATFSTTSLQSNPGAGIEPAASWVKTRRHCQQQLPRSGSRGTRTHKRFYSPPVFETGSSSSRSTSVSSNSVPGAGIEPAASWVRTRRHYQQQLPRNRVLHSSDTRLRLQVRTFYQECPAGVEPACPVWKTGASAARPRAHFPAKAEGGGVEPTRKPGRPHSGPSGRPELRRQESNLRQLG